MTAEADRAFDLHWSNDHELYLAVLAYSTALLKRVPSMTPQTLGRNMLDNIRRWCADRYVSGLGWYPDTEKQRRRGYSVQSSQMALFPTLALPPGYFPVTTQVLDGMARELEPLGWRVDETAFGETLLEALDGEAVMDLVREAKGQA